MTPKIFERTYAALKQELTSGAYAPGQRLQARALADRLGTSTSPVTDSMRQMIGEDVLEYSAQDGFVIPRVTVRRLHDLYQLANWLTARCHASTVAVSVTVRMPFQKISPESVVHNTEALFLDMATAAQNGELTRLVANTNDRLRACRLLEPQLFNDLASELEGLRSAWVDGDLKAVQASLDRYHARRLEAVPQLVSLSYPERA